MGNNGSFSTEYIVQIIESPPRHYYKNNSSNASIFFRERSKYHLFLQREWGYYSNRTVPENPFVQACHPLTHPYNLASFLGADEV
jgi:hypothetical protein